MGSNYKKLGAYIQIVNERNSSLSGHKLLGVSIKKCFMPSIANIIGTDMSTYKLIRKKQFAYGPVTSRNGDKISIALLEDYEEALVSQAYVVFEIKDFNELDPEYLMMWFRRFEFDRYARFKSHGSAREIFDWAEMCEVELPIPSIEIQREIVREYNTIVNRITLNEQLYKKLEETAQAVYKQWFMEFEFPNENGKPYKTSGGKMVWCEELGKEIPEGWEVKTIVEICEVVNGRAYKETEFVAEGTPIIRIQNLNGGLKFVYSDLKLDKDKYVERGDFIFAWSATFGPFIWRGPKSIYHYHIWKMKPYQKELKFLLFNYFFLETERVSGEGSGSIFAHITKGLMESQKVLIPNQIELKMFHEFSVKIDNLIENLIDEKNHLIQLKETILAKMTKVEEIIEKELNQ